LKKTFSLFLRTHKKPNMIAISDPKPSAQTKQEALMGLANSVTSMLRAIFAPSRKRFLQAKFDPSHAVRVREVMRDNDIPFREFDFGPYIAFRIRANKRHERILRNGLGITKSKFFQVD
jgi:hypothetical protein